jgi:hypothetical protein
MQLHVKQAALLLLDRFVECDLVERRQEPADRRARRIVATDHGHVDEGGHGGDSPEERTAWIAACGSGVPTGGPLILEQADVAGHVHHVLGLAGQPDPFVGLPFGTRTELAGA